MSWFTTSLSSECGLYLSTKRGIAHDALTTAGRPAQVLTGDKASWLLDISRQERSGSQFGLTVTSRRQSVRGRGAQGLAMTAHRVY